MSGAGFFVVVEGPEGAGKTTLTRSLADRLVAVGLDPVVVREPGGTEVAEAIRRELLDPARRFDPARELLYLAAARADLVHHVIRPALASGRFVLSDRFTLSTRAYQGAGRGLDPAWIDWMNRVATDGIEPDLTLVLDVPAAVGLARQRAGGKRPDRLEREDAAFHERVAAAYRAAEGPGVVHLDATRPPDQVLEEAWRALPIAAARPARP
ncbi:MAG TPA: dTMP kinase [Gemmatimonadales bacterium]|nr:dTMP kinase [Gemmatimonadales bacterium]